MAAPIGARQRPLKKIGALFCGKIFYIWDLMSAIWLQCGGMFVIVNFYANFCIVFLFFNVKKDELPPMGIRRKQITTLRRQQSRHITTADFSVTKFR